MEPRRCTPEESELFIVTLIFFLIISFDQSTSVILNSFVSLICSLCHGYKGIWDVKFLFLLLSVCVCVCYTCVSIPGFKSILCFIFFLSFTMGKLSVLYTLLAVSPTSAPLLTSQQGLISIWESGVPGMLTRSPLQYLVISLQERL